MTWITTYTGKKFSFIDPQPEDICIKDIAHHLGNLCRFVGASSTFYSVAQHSLLVSKLVPRKEAYNGLMHDAGEAYYGDLSKPFKIAMEQIIGSGWNKIIKHIDEVITVKFGVKESDEVKKADKIILAIEKRDLMHNSVFPIDLPEPLTTVMIFPLNPTIATFSFLRRYWRLTDDSNYFHTH